MTPARSIADWQGAYRSGAALGDWLPAFRARTADCGEPVYLHVASEAALQARMLALQQRAACFASDTERDAALPLYGVPFVIKDHIDVAGVTTTAACPAFTRTAAQHATAVRRLLDAGAVWLAKTNLDQFATGLVGTRSPYGAPQSVLHRVVSAAAAVRVPPWPLRVATCRLRWAPTPQAPAACLLHSTAWSV